MTFVEGRYVPDKMYSLETFLNQMIFMNILHKLNIFTLLSIDVMKFIMRNQRIHKVKLDKNAL